MKRFLFAGLCALAAGLGGAGSAGAQCLSSPYGCSGICLHLFPCAFQHGPLYNYGPHENCGNGGCGHGGLWGPWNRSAGCNSCGSAGWAGLGWHRGAYGSGGCDSCGSSGWGQYARTTFVNVFARLHPTANKCGQTCGLTCGQSTGGCNTCGGHGAFGGCGTCGGHAWGGLLGNRGCSNGGCDSCGGNGLGGLFGNRGGCGGHCAGGGGLQTAPWYLYWPTTDNRFLVPGPNAAGWRGQHFVVSAPAPYGSYGQAAGVNPYFPASYGPPR